MGGFRELSPDGLQGVDVGDSGEAEEALNVVLPNICRSLLVDFGILRGHYGGGGVKMRMKAIVAGVIVIVTLVMLKND